MFVTDFVIFYLFTPAGEVESFQPKMLSTYFGQKLQFHICLSFTSYVDVYCSMNFPHSLRSFYFDIYINV